MIALRLSTPPPRRGTAGRFGRNSASGRGLARPDFPQQGADGGTGKLGTLTTSERDMDEPRLTDDGLSVIVNGVVMTPTDARSLATRARALADEAEHAKKVIASRPAFEEGRKRPGVIEGVGLGWTFRAGETKAPALFVRSPDYLNSWLVMFEHTGRWESISLHRIVKVPDTNVTINGGRVHHVWRGGEGAICGAELWNSNIADPAKTKMCVKCARKLAREANGA